jgi:hypothetical protein
MPSSWKIPLVPNWIFSFRFSLCRPVSNIRLLYVCYLWYAIIIIQPIPVAERSKAWVYGRSLAGIVVSNPAGGMDVCL